MKKLRTLFVGAHTDDIEFGSGCFIQHQENKQAVVFSNCVESIPEGFHKNATRKELKQSMDLLNCDCTLYYYKVRKFDKNRNSIREVLHSLQKEFNFELIVTHCSFDTHQDHQIIHEECKRVFKSASILGYFEPKNNYNEKADFYHLPELEEIELCYEAINCYKSQMAKYDYVKAKAIILQYFGIKVGQQFAEPFEVIRWINK
jgi:LmbE family N-acetylglucosaminyl deacetylase